MMQYNHRFKYGDSLLKQGSQDCCHHEHIEVNSVKHWVGTCVNCGRVVDYSSLQERLSKKTKENARAS